MKLSFLTLPVIAQEYFLFEIIFVIVNPLECKGNYSATSNNQLFGIGALWEYYS